MTQLAIDLPYRPALGRADFLVSECNAAALGWIERWPQWVEPTLILHGPPGCGKSHLAHLWQERSGGTLVQGGALNVLEPNHLARCRAVAVDDAESAPEEALLHLYNCCGEGGTSLLIVAREAPTQWPIALPDLASRLRAAPAVSIALPDDTLLGAVLVKHFADRQVRVAPGVIAFMMRRMERSFAAAGALAAKLDQLALSAGRPIGLATARQALAETIAAPVSRTGQSAPNR